MSHSSHAAHVSRTASPLAVPMRSGFVALAGRPNVGKSTLTNAIVGSKVAIVSDKPQTTRRAIRAVAGGPDWQLVLVDLPGVQRPRDTLTERMQRRVESELKDADACLMIVNAQQGIGPGDRFIAGLLAKASGSTPVILAVNKIDLTKKAQTIEVLAAAQELGVADEIFPISARTGNGVGPLTEHLVSMLPAGPTYFESDQRSDQSEFTLLAELVREQVLIRTHDEVPHSVEVEVESVGPMPSREPGEDDLIRVDAVVLVETESQKGILIGSGGRMIKAIGMGARRAIERELGSRVHLALSVRVRRHWRADDKILDRLGIE